MAEGAARPVGTVGRRLGDLLLAGLTAVLTFGGFPTALSPEWSFWPLLWISHVPVLWLLRDKSPREAFRWGWLTGTLINAGGYYWLAEMLQRFGHLPAPFAALGLLLHSVYVGFLWAAWAWLMNRVSNTTPLPVTWTAPLAMVAVELVVPRIFPAYMGNSQYPWPLVMQICDVTGIYGVTFLIYRVNATLYVWVRALVDGRQRPWRATAVTAGLLAATLVYGAVRITQVDLAVEAAPKLRIGIAEGSIGIFESETRDRIRDHLLIQQRLTADLERRGAELVLWSESSYRVPYIIPRDERRLRPSIVPLATDWRADRRPGTTEWDRTTPIRGFEVPVLLGATTSSPRSAPRFEGDTADAYFNSAVLLDGDGTIHGRYDKNYLLIGGEYIPFSEYFPWIYKVIPAAGDLARGRSLEPITADLWGRGPVRIGVLVCYEGILPAFARGLAAGDPHFIVNMTNDDWFGRTAERYLHFALTIPRAIEHRRAFARPTLTGVSAFVDPVGRVVSQSPVTGEDALLASVPLLEIGSPYLQLGDVFAWACALCLATAYGWGRWRRRV